MTKSRSGTFVGVKNLNLKPTKYRLWAQACYKGLWYSERSPAPVEFIVAGKMLETGHTVRPEMSMREAAAGVKLIGVRGDFRVNGEILIEVSHASGATIDFAFQRYLQNRWIKYDGVIVLQKLTRKTGGKAISRLRLKLKEAGKFRVKAGTSQWSELEIKDEQKSKRIRLLP